MHSTGVQCQIGKQKWMQNSKMSKYKPSKTFRTWLESKSVVVVGYFDWVNGVNLDFLLAGWIDATQDGEAFSDCYPHAADYFQVTVIEKSDPRLEQPGILLRVLDDYRYCKHLKVWSDGEEMDSKDVSEILDEITTQRGVSTGI